MTQSNPMDSNPAPTVPGGSDPVHRPAGDHEEVYYEGTPQIRGSLGKVLLYGIIGLFFVALPLLLPHVFVTYKGHAPWWLNLAFVLIGIILMIIPILSVKRVRYRITNYRIDYEFGLLSKNIDTLELWHVEDITFHQSLFARIIGVGTIKVLSHDDTLPNLELHSIPKARELFEILKQRVIAVKRQPGVMKVDSGTLR